MPDENGVVSLLTDESSGLYLLIARLFEVLFQLFALLGN